MVLLAVIVAVTNFIVDIVAALIDPRVRYCHEHAMPQLSRASRRAWFRRLPVISHFNKSVGLQRGMLVAGLVLTALFLLTAMFAPADRALRLLPSSPTPTATSRRSSRPAGNTSGAPRSAAMTSSPG